MKKRTLGTCVNDNDYNKVISYIDLYNKITNNQDSISKFIWECVKFRINYLRNHKGIK